MTIVLLSNTARDSYDRDSARPTALNCKYISIVEKIWFHNGIVNFRNLVKFVVKLKFFFPLFTIFFLNIFSERVGYFSQNQSSSIWCELKSVSIVWNYMFLRIHFQRCNRDQHTLQKSLTFVKILFKCWAEKRILSLADLRSWEIVLYDCQFFFCFVLFVLLLFFFVFLFLLWIE